jgi:hypothetical protein
MVGVSCAKEDETGNRAGYTIRDILEDMASTSSFATFVRGYTVYTMSILASLYTDEAIYPLSV